LLSVPPPPFGRAASASDTCVGPASPVPREVEVPRRAMWQNGDDDDDDDDEEDEEGDDEEEGEGAAEVGGMVAGDDWRY